MRSDLRAEWRALRVEADDEPPSDSRRPIVFSGTVHTVIVSQTISAQTVHIAASPGDEEDRGA